MRMASRIEWKEAKGRKGSGLIHSTYNKLCLVAQSIGDLEKFVRHEFDLPDKYTYTVRNPSIPFNGNQGS